MVLGYSRNGKMMKVIHSCLTFGKSCLTLHYDQWMEGMVRQVSVQNEWELPDNESCVGRFERAAMGVFTTLHSLQELKQGLDACLPLVMAWKVKHTR